jgi:hypothetical protein
MTPKEKAKELYDKYCNMESWCDDAKECALIAVDEVIKQNNVWIRLVNKGTNNYWLEVKQEIEKL